jgi:hypothetical protein
MNSRPLPQGECHDGPVKRPSYLQHVQEVRELAFDRVLIALPPDGEVIAGCLFSPGRENARLPVNAKKVQDNRSRGRQ